MNGSIFFYYLYSYFFICSAFGEKLDVSYTKECPEIMASYTSKPHDETSTKAHKTREQANLRNDLKKVQGDYDQEGKFNEAVERYKFIYTQAMGKDLQNIASDAEALKVNFIKTKFYQRF